MIIRDQQALDSIDLAKDIVLAVTGFVAVSAILIAGIGIACVLAGWSRRMNAADRSDFEPLGDASTLDHPDVKKEPEPRGA